ncbi:MAG: hypothetical protein D6705_00050 [Deltaproteobacteria bacterium]|nr:MAG: hypothetical protein D6705_00050 [Deltaproteobacteria bacterium]
MFREEVGRRTFGRLACGVSVLGCLVVACERGSDGSVVAGGSTTRARTSTGSAAPGRPKVEAATLRYVPAVDTWAGDRPHAVLFEVDEPAARRAHAVTLVVGSDGVTLMDLALVPARPDGSVVVAEAETLWRLDVPGDRPSEAVTRLGRLAAAPGNRVRRPPPPDPVAAWNAAADDVPVPRDRLRRMADWFATLDDAVLTSPKRSSACRRLLQAGGPFRREDVSARRARIVSPHGTADLLLRGRTMVVTNCTMGSAPD